mmetsp:Transcript_5477/g.16180  ORF Transcript_5477/g.16180 Transcript_5477/m.16180 type:complete len:285 (+) Transcript_5477:1744-2598(+)
MRGSHPRWWRAKLPGRLQHANETMRGGVATAAGHIHLVAAVMTHQTPQQSSYAVHYTPGQPACCDLFWGPGPRLVPRDICLVAQMRLERLLSHSRLSAARWRVANVRSSSLRPWARWTSLRPSWLLTPPVSHTAALTVGRLLLRARALSTPSIGRCCQRRPQTPRASERGDLRRCSRPAAAVPHLSRYALLTRLVTVKRAPVTCFLYPSRLVERALISRAQVVSSSSTCAGTPASTARLCAAHTALDRRAPSTSTGSSHPQAQWKPESLPSRAHRRKRALGRAT